MERSEVFCVFEGGGAKGVAHVGFLRAIDSEASFDVKGFAGTSAGAIVAALAAAGWKGTELYCDDEAGKASSSALQALERISGKRISNLSELIERKDWLVIKYLRQIVDDSNKETGTPGVVVTEKIKRALRAAFFVVASAAVLSLVLAALRMPLLGVLVVLGLAAIVLFLLIVLEFILVRYRGFASTTRLIKIIEALIKEKLPTPPSGLVSFAELRKQTGRDLKVVAANLETGQLELFSSETTPTVSVARAVMASAAIPLVFRPVKILGREYCDGGIVSNLPAWTFDAERINNERCLTFTCEIKPPATQPGNRKDLKGARLLARVAVTALFGGSGLNTRGMLRHLRLESWADFNLLDFEKTQQQVDHIKASEELGRIKIERERYHTNSIELVYRRALEVCRAHGIEGADLRVCYVRPVRVVDAPVAAYHLWNCFNFGSHADRHMVLPARN